MVNWVDRLTCSGAQKVFDRGSLHVFVHFVILITVCELLVCTLKSALKSSVPHQVNRPLQWPYNYLQE